MVPGPTASVIPWECDRNANSHNFPRPTESEVLDWGPAICVLRSPPDDSDARQNLRITVLYYAFLNHLSFIKF